MAEQRLGRLLIAFALLFGVVLVQCFRLQVLDEGDHVLQLETRLRRSISVLPRRGPIEFADGTPMASNEPGFGVHVNLAEFDADRWDCRVCGLGHQAKRRPGPRPKACPTCNATSGLSLLLTERERPLPLSDGLQSPSDPWTCAEGGHTFEVPVATKPCPDACPRCESADALVPVTRPSLASLSRLLEVTPDQLSKALATTRRKRRYRRAKRLMRYESFVLLPRVSREVGQAVALAGAAIPGLRAVPVADRQVVPFAASIVGRVKQPTPEHVTRLTDRERSKLGLHVYKRSELYQTLFGVTGLERRHDERLRGVPGRGERLRAPKDGGGPRTRMVTDVTDGVRLRTTIEPTVQALAHDLVESADGDAAAVVLNVNTGAVVAIASRSKDGYHHAVTALHPGSVFKLVTALAHLHGGGSLDHTESCGQRGYVRKGLKYKCDGLHNDIALEWAFAKSCNAYFMKRAHHIGPEAMQDACKRLGFERNWRLGLKGGPAGLELSPKLGNTWASWNIDYIGIGQGKSTASAVQVAVAYARLANGGRLVTPFLLAEEAAERGTPSIDPVLARHGDVLRRAARLVVTDGTGRKIQALAAVAAAGKSGTAERPWKSTDPGTKRKFINNAWFVGYAPHDAPRYVAVVVHERVLGHGAEVSGQPVGSLLEAALNVPERPLER